MTQDSVVCVEEECEPQLLCPDRKKFQNLLEEYSSVIEVNLAKQEKMWQKISELNAGIDDANHQIKILREPYRFEITKIENKLTQLKTESYELQTQCIHRDMQKLETCLQQKEKEYSTKTMSIKLERMLVGEISALKRNKTFLLQLNSVKKQIQDHELALPTLKSMLYNKEIKKLKSAVEETKIKRSQYSKELSELRSRIRDVSTKKNTLIRKYKEDSYLWNQKSKKNRTNQYPPNFFSTSTRQTYSFIIDDEELEPFYEQKNECRMLISYLERLDSQRINSKRLDLRKLDPQIIIVKKNNIDVSANSNSDIDGDSADEYPAHFQNLTKCSVPVSSLKKKARRNCVKRIASNTSYKNKKFDNQPISHDLNLYQLFGRTETDVPATYGNVEQILQQVEDRLALLVDKTNEIEWDEMNMSDFNRSISTSRTTSVAGSTFGF